MADISQCSAEQCTFSAQHYKKAKQGQRSVNAGSGLHPWPLFLIFTSMPPLSAVVNMWRYCPSPARPAFSGLDMISNLGAATAQLRKLVPFMRPGKRQRWYRYGVTAVRKGERARKDDDRKVTQEIVVIPQLL
jgi:hypothetical protein